MFLNGESLNTNIEGGTHLYLFSAQWEIRRSSEFSCSHPTCNRTISNATPTQRAAFPMSSVAMPLLLDLFCCTSHHPLDLCRQNFPAPLSQMRLSVDVKSK